jgi:N-acetylmuramoyl-L-alanine amidase-like
VRRERVLNVVAGLAPVRTRLTCVPKRAFATRAGDLRGGDLIFFVSTRANLDIFHCGIIERDGKQTTMRHAARSRGMVVEEPLADFLKANRMAGVIVVRPREIADGISARIGPAAHTDKPALRQARG